MKAAIYDGNNNMEIKEHPDPVPKAGEVLVNIKYSGICGSQINEIDATKGPDKYLPHLLGHEGSGIVEETGEGVTRVKKGDHVVLHWRKSSGLEAESAKYKWKGKKVNSGKVTTFSEKSILIRTP